MAEPASEQAWLAAIRAAALRGDQATAQASLASALLVFPQSFELRRVDAGLLQQAGRFPEAATKFEALLREHPQDATSALALARIRADDGRAAAAAAIVRGSLGAPENVREPGLAIAAIELLDDCDRKSDAAAIAEAACAANPRDARLHAYAGMLLIQLGRFNEARRHYLYALEHDQRAWEWHAPIGLSSAQRYDDPQHPDFALFEGGMQREGLSDFARAELQFALGKAHGDTGDIAKAAQHLRAGNALRHRLTAWTRKAWRRSVEARLAAQPLAAAVPTPGFAPVFIVGMPRTGTTLLATLLARHGAICNRGELPWLARLAQRPDLSGTPGRDTLQVAAAEYARHARRDDAPPDARWFIDKQPLNFRYVDLALALFPDARIIHCVRNPRDTALSLWMQCFLEDVQGYSYDFGDIALVMRDCERLMAHWNQRFPDQIRTIHYEQLVSDPEAVTDTLAQWLGVASAPGTTAMPSTPISGIATASLWQARQPVNTRSVGRWQRYSQVLPELLRFPG